MHRCVVLLAPVTDFQNQHLKGVKIYASLMITLNMKLTVDILSHLKRYIYIFYDYKKFQKKSFCEIFLTYYITEKINIMLNRRPLLKMMYLSN